MTEAARELAEQHAADADRPGADNEDAVVLARAGAADRVGADRQKLDHRRLIEGDSVSRRDVGFWDTHVVGHAAVDVHAQDADRWQQLVLPRRQATQTPQAR